MAAAYLATADVDAAIGATERQVLLSDTEAVGGYSATYFTAINNRASELAKAMAEKAGYSPGDTTTDQRLIAATLGLFLVEAYSRKQGGEEGRKRVAPHLLMAVDDLRSGKLKLTSTPTTLGAAGGAQFSESDRTATTNWAPVFSRERLGKYY